MTSSLNNNSYVIANEFMNDEAIFEKLMSYELMN